MWKTIVLCGSLFGGAALGLAAIARWVEPTAIPATAAIGLCLIGVVLILAAPGPTEELDDDEAAPTFTAPTPVLLRVALARSSGSIKALSSSGSLKALITPAPENAALEKLL